MSFQQYFVDNSKFKISYTKTALLIGKEGYSSDWNYNSVLDRYGHIFNLKSNDIENLDITIICDDKKLSYYHPLNITIGYIEQTYNALGYLYGEYRPESKYLQQRAKVTISTQDFDQIDPSLLPQINITYSSDVDINIDGIQPCLKQKFNIAEYIQPIINDDDDDYDDTENDINDDNDNNNKSKGGLSKEAKIGIIVGCAVVAVVAIVVIIACVVKHKKKVIQSSNEG